MIARTALPRSCRLLPLLIAGALPTAALAGLPPPPREAILPAALQLRLELVVNDAPTGRVVGVEARTGRFLVDADDLRGVHIRVPPPVAGPIDLADLAGVVASYDQAGQRLLLHVPSEWLPQQTLGNSPTPVRIEPESSFGAVLNYDLYLARGGTGDATAALWNDARVFGRFGVVRSTGVYRQPLAGKGGGRFTRYDTQWTYIDDDRALTYEAGDLVTRTLPSTSPVRLGGVQLSRDFSVRPDIVTYPLPSFSGTAAVPSAVDLFINGHHTSSGQLAPGPYTLTDMPYVSGAGEAVVVTTDAQGRRISTSIPFYVANTLLRPGLDDFAVSIGKLRRDYGRENFAYGAMAASGAWRHGLTDWLTVEAQAQGARSLALGGAGGTIRIGNLGVIDVSGTVSRHDGAQGTQIQVGYQYSNRRFNLAMRHTERDRDYVDLGNYGVAPARAAREETQVSANLVLPARLGTLGGSYIETGGEAQGMRLANLSYFKALWNRGSMLVSANRDLDKEQTSAMVQLVVSLGRGGTAVGGVERDPQGSLRERIAYSRAVPTEGGLGWRAELAHGDRHGEQYQAELTWRAPFAQVQAGAYGSRQGDTQWADVSGSLVLMGGGVFAANRINDAFVLVSTDGVAGVPVLHENQRVGVTGRGGYLLVPWVKAYQPAKFAIDPLDLSADVSTPVVEQYAAVTLGGGRLVHFPVRKLAAAMVVLNDRAGKPLPAGTPVSTDRGFATRIAWEGEAYLENLAPDNRLTATLEDGTTCTARFAFDIARAGAEPIGPLPCL
ncbi:fimbria/pilus outer membrane usher protein [Novosphingobium album (ex Liu et al. 2023)]|uniref:Fimbria/pilus outer membrane usher protein n=1 Tax=Novosphingobium album (ex Liu et al. 2023) TaxID=3031130 RepID=A0ABT5WRG6_9SPHN|nr:fimbria/pilus outer membrane usher protein [Novosphingobium album (ex Liu et al. 2023)]MDE8652331.1 fimbria/pilus outer membrane usher protein [Novosphingobium album (ex Liu et al. 2023)]